MKTSAIKLFIVIVLAMLLSFIGMQVAPTEGHRDIISFLVAFITLSATLIMAFAIDYNSGLRNVNIKVVAYIGVLVTLVGNVAFSFFLYPVMIYMAVMGTVTLLTLAWIVALVPSRNEKEISVLASAQSVSPEDCQLNESLNEVATDEVPQELGAINEPQASELPGEPHETEIIEEITEPVERTE